MSIYRYSTAPVIDEITIRRNYGGAARAYLHAKEGIDPNLLKNTQCRLSSLGLQCIPSRWNGAPVLEVRGFTSDAQLLSTLSQNGFTGEKYEKIEEKEDHITVVNQLKKRSLQAAGVSFLTADVAFAKYGYEKASKLDMLAGLFYGMGTISSLIFGRKDPSDLQIKDLSARLAKYVNDQNIPLNNGYAANVISDTTYQHPLKKMDEFLRHYPSELLNLSFAMAGVCIATSALKGPARATMEAIKGDADTLKQVERKLTEIAKKKGIALPTPEKIAQESLKQTHHEGWLDAGLGINTFASGVFGAFVKEKKRDPDQPPAHGIEAAWQWAQERPLTITATGYLVSTLCHAVSTIKAHQYGNDERRAQVIYRGAFVAMNIVAELFVSLSSKGHGDGVKSDKSVDQSIVALAADLIVHQPASQQEQLITCVAGFLGQKDVLGLRDRDIKSTLQQAVESMRLNPWAKAMQMPALGEARPLTADSPSPSVWQSRVTQQALSGHDLSKNPAH